MGIGLAGAVGAGLGLLRRIVPMVPSAEISVVDDGVCAVWVGRRNRGGVRSDGVPFVFTGRLDNRDELADRLGLTPSHAVSGFNDPALAAVAWERWGERALDCLVGGFAIAAWDPAAQELILATDPTGNETVYTVAHPDGFAFADRPHNLRAAFGDVVGGANLEQIAQWLWNTSLSPEHSLISGIGRLPPGEVWRVNRSGIHRRVYWRPGEVATIRFHRDQDYVDAARALLDQVVRPHLPENGRLTAELTGGLDSSGVVATAARLAPHLVIDAFTSVPEAGAAIPYDIPGHSGDEWSTVQAIAERYANVTPNRVEAGGLTPVEREPVGFFEDNCAPPFLTPSFGWAHQRMEAMARSGPSRVLLGTGGNQTLSRSGYDRLPELLRGGRWPTLAWEIVALTRKDGASWRKYLAQCALHPALSPQWRRRFRRWRGHDLSYWANLNVIRPEAIARFGLTQTTAEQGFTHPAHRQFGRDGMIAEVTRILNNWTLTVSRYQVFGLDARAPLLDRRMIDFCLALPSDQFLRGGVTRFLARRVLADRLPDRVTARSRTYLNCPEWHHRLTRARPDWMAAIERMADSAAVNELIDVPKLQKLAQSWPDTPTMDQEPLFRMILPRTIAAGQFIRWANREN